MNKFPPRTIRGSGDRILLAHGSGGEMMHRLISDVILRRSGAVNSADLDDAAALTIDGADIAFTTDTFVVKPLFFPGGDIGSLAVSGTVNDLLMKGALPLYLSLGFVLEEGFPIDTFERILDSIRAAAEDAGVSIVTGDTKVVNRGDADGIFINTSGVGSILSGVRVSGNNARPGDAVLVSGTVGRHGVAVMAERNGLNLKGDIGSDAAPLTGAVMPLLERFPGAVHTLRDPTRGGVGTTLNEIARASRVGITIIESAVPVDESVHMVCELLGFEPLYLPCEGRFLAFVDRASSGEVLAFLRTGAGCPEAAVIGEVTTASPGMVQLRTSSGGLRILDMPSGELLPRIC